MIAKKILSNYEQIVIRMGMKKLETILFREIQFWNKRDQS